MTSLYEQPEPPRPVSLETAFDELSVQAFACWIRLMTVQEWELEQGRNYLAKKLNTPRRTMDRYLTELTEKGYLELTKRPGTTTIFVLKLAPLLVSPNHFIDYR